MADNYSPWVGPQNKLQGPKNVDPTWAKMMTPEARARAWGSFAGDDPPPAAAAPAQVPGQYQGQGMTINGTPPAKPPLVVNISGAHFQKPTPQPPVHRPAAPRVAPSQPGFSPAPIVQQPSDDGTVYGPDDSTYQSLLANLDEANISGLADQKKGLSDEEARLAQMRGREPDVDLSALLAYQDSTQGTNLSKGYKRPATQDELDAQADGLQELIQKNRQGLSKDQIQILDNALNAEGRRLGIDEQSYQRSDTAKAVAALNNTGRTDVAGINAGAGIQKATIGAGAKTTAAGITAAGRANAKGGTDLHKYQTDYMKDPAVKDATGKLQQVQTAEGLLEDARTNPMSRAANQVVLARTFSPSRLNQTEITAMGGDKAAIQVRLEQAWKELSAGQLSDANYQYIKRFIGVMRTSANHTIHDRLQFHGTNYSTATGKPLEEATQAIGGSDYKPPAAGSGGGAGLLDAIKAEQARRAAAAAGGQK